MEYYQTKRADEPLRMAKDSDAPPKEFRGLTQAELDSVNDLFPHYLFYERTQAGRRFWTSCCHQEGREAQLLEAPLRTAEEQAAFFGGHGAAVRCPFCGRAAKLLAAGTARSCRKLEEYIPVVLLDTADDGATIYAQAYWTRKHYETSRAAEAEFHAVGVYRFRRGEAVWWENCGVNCWRRQENGFFSEPFRSGGGIYLHLDDYRVMGRDCLKSSFLRYVSIDRCQSRVGAGRWWGLISFLALAAQYPENVEMLQKAGMNDVLDDWTRRRKKNAAAIRWGETDPRQAFGLSGQELREFLSTARDIDTIALYKTLRRRGERITVKEAADTVEKLGAAGARKLMKLSRENGLSLLQARRYLGGTEDPICVRLQEWEDYLHMARELGYPVHRSDALMPRDLHAAHEAAVGDMARRQGAARAQREKERAAAAEKRRIALERRYGYGKDGLLIRAPKDAEEIRAEGQALKHCVGGYAERHADGRCTILFLRREKEPDKPFLTIEMNGAKLIQIHGFRNEGMYTAQGRFAPDPREVYRAFLDPWLAWVAKGSPRGKDGEPKLPRARKKEKVEVQIA